MQLSAFKTYVKLDFTREDKDTQLVQAYNDMIVWVALQMPHAGYKYQSYATTSAGVENVLLPTDQLHLIHPIRLILGSAPGDSGYPLEFITKEESGIREPNPNGSQPPRGRPSAYTVYGRQILLTPIPDLSTYILEIDQSRRPTALSLDAETSNLGSEWDQVLKAGVLERLYASLSMYDEAAYWGSKYHDQEDNPIGLCRKLFNIERDRETHAIGQIKNNSL